MVGLGREFGFNFFCVEIDVSCSERVGFGMGFGWCYFFFSVGFGIVRGGF